MLTAVMTVLGILKIAGLVLLGILGLLLLLLLIILLVPVRYRAQGSYRGGLRFDALASWFFHFLTVRAVYEEKLDLTVRICGHMVYRKGKRKAEKAGEMAEAGPDAEEEAGTEAAGEAEIVQEAENVREAEEEPETGNETGQGIEASPGSESETGREAETGPEDGTENLQSADEKTESKAAPDEAEAGEPSAEEAGPEADPGPAGGAAGYGTDTEAGNVRSEKETGDAAEAGGPRRKQKKRRRVFPFRQICDKLKQRFRAVRDKLLALKEKKDRIQAMIRDESNRRSIRLTLRQTKKLLRHMAPRKMEGHVKFGFEDPYTTGQVLVYVSPFYGLYADKVELIPVFGEKVLEGEGKMRGRVGLGVTLVVLGRLLLDKNIRMLLKKLLS